MGKIIGRKNRNYNTDWRIRVNLIGGDEAVIAEQLTEKEALVIYKETITKMKNNKDYIEFQTDGRGNSDYIEFFNKRNILSIEMKRY